MINYDKTVTQKAYPKVRLRLSINLLIYKNGVWGEAPSKVAGAAAPDIKPLPEGKGFGDGD